MKSLLCWRQFDHVVLFMTRRTLFFFVVVALGNISRVWVESRLERFWADYSFDSHQVSQWVQVISLPQLCSWKQLRAGGWTATSPWHSHWLRAARTHTHVITHMPSGTSADTWQLNFKTSHSKYPGLEQQKIKQKYLHQQLRHLVVSVRAGVMKRN